MATKGFGGDVVGICSLFFREAGEFWSEAFQWAEAKSDEQRQAADTRRRMEAEAKLLEQMRLAREAGLDVDDILAKVRNQPRTA